MWSEGTLLYSWMKLLALPFFTFFFLFSRHMSHSVQVGGQRRNGVIGLSVGMWSGVHFVYVPFQWLGASA